MNVDIGALADFPEGRIRIVEVEGREIGIANWRGTLYGLRNVCPHQYGPLCSGALVASLNAATRMPVAMDAQQDRPVVICAWHGWEFDVLTGRALCNQDVRVAVYTVTVSGDRIMLDFSRRKPSPEGVVSAVEPAT